MRYSAVFLFVLLFWQICIVFSQTPTPSPTPFPIIRNVSKSFDFPAFKSQNDTQDLLFIGAASFYKESYSFGHGHTAVRLTPSQVLTTGSAWYNYPMPLKFGFEVEFTFRLSQNVTKRVGEHEAVNMATKYGDENIIQFGGDGFAFVATGLPLNESMLGAGRAGSGLGYEGLSNAVVVEFDTFMNEELSDPYPGHLSVLTRGTGTAVASHNFGFGAKPPPAYGFVEDFEGGLTMPDMRWESTSSMVNFIYPNVTPPYNYGFMASAFDSRVHSVKIVYDPTTWDGPSMTVSYDGEEAVRALVNLNQTMVMLQDRRCPNVTGCLQVSDDGSAVCVSQRDQTKFSYEYGRVVRPYEYFCARCFFSDFCVGHVGFTAATGQMVENHDILSWKMKTFVTQDEIFILDPWDLEQLALQQAAAAAAAAGGS